MGIRRCRLQVIVEALRALSTCFLALPVQENAALNGDTLTEDVGNDAPDAVSVVSKHGAMLHETLKKARYHQIKHCRDAASEALSILKSMVPETALRSAAPEVKLQTSVMNKTSTAASRKGPWLHQKGSGASKDANENASLAQTRKPATRPKSAALATLAAAQRYSSCWLMFVLIGMICTAPLVTVKPRSPHESQQPLWRE